jgi:hypothetical protein
MLLPKLCIDRQLIVSNEDAFAYPQAQIGFPVPEGFFLPAVAQKNNEARELILFILGF